MTRQITTEAELDALPTRSVVLDKHGRAWQLRHRWVCNDTKVNGIYIPTDFGPATVLYVPDEPEQVTLNSGYPTLPKDAKPCVSFHGPIKETS